MRRLIVLALALSCACVGARTTDVTIGSHRFRVQVAATEALREHGLMGVKKLAADHGVLFVWKDVAPREFYMKDTVIRLDLISIRVRTVVGAATLIPCKSAQCPIPTPTSTESAFEVPA